RPRGGNAGRVLSPVERLKGDALVGRRHQFVKGFAGQGIDGRGLPFLEGGGGKFVKRKSGVGGLPVVHTRLWYTGRAAVSGDVCHVRARQKSRIIRSDGRPLATVHG